MCKSDYSETSQHSYYSNTLFKYVELCDMHNIRIFTQESIAIYEDYLFEKYRLGKIKNSTYTREISDLTRLFLFLELPKSWFSDVRVLGSNQSEPFEGYSREDLKQLLPILRSMFKQIAEQFLDDPKKHIDAHHKNPTFSFYWKNKEFKLLGGITKLVGCATYLMSYYTWSNSTTLYSLIRPRIVSHTLSEQWYSMPAFKRRAFKTISVEMGEHKLEIPKYAMTFFDTLMKVSQVIDPSDNAFLLQTVIQKKVKPITGNLLSDSVKFFINKNICLLDARGRKLYPVISRFRETGSNLTIISKGDLEAAILLDNTPKTVRQNYSKGNEHENNKMISDTVSVLESSVRNNSTVKEAKITVKNELEITVLTYEQYLEDKAKLARNIHGSHCKNNNDSQAEKYQRKVKIHNLSLGEKLICADLIGCFGCEHQVIVESVHDIWCLLSFAECIEDSKYSHLNTLHFEKNFKEVLEQINAIQKKLNPKILRQAKTKLNTEGRHPIWDSAEQLNIVRNKK